MLANEYIQIQTEIAIALQKKMDLVRELEVCEKEQQINAQYVEEFAMLTSEKVGYGFHSLEIWVSVVMTEAHIKDSDLKMT
ncbi:PREDICTED: mitogen-activated protein kinase kinase kinase 7-like [Acropora digitifera]|uniref:mitogen-activated protein kinase kinase kinase 7-like n=1 Tax=Acropora digitifera TaxID=70779 RepID=UPI00077A6484|nr:PREDICTED: mitogen-activated protein kinase kinase kinase 7-like [Acropora digitifera]